MMERMIMKANISKVMVAGFVSLLSVAAMAQTGAAPAAPTAKQPAPLVLSTLSPTGKADPFPPVNPKYFSAATPTVETVNSFLQQLWGYDPNRIWRVAAIQATPAAGIAKVVVFVTDKSPNAKVQSTSFFVTPDGTHALAGDGIVPFGAKPFEAAKKVLQAGADGATRGASSKELMLVEFADLQCPHCKDAQGTMDQLVKDFPNARVVYQSFPLTEIHPFAFKAAAYGYCVQHQKNDAFFPYAAAVYDTQAALTPEAGDATLKAAVVKAGLDPAAIDACSNTQATKDQVNNSIKLAEAAGIDQTPSVAVNGHVMPLSQIPYETLKAMITNQAALDGVNGSGPAIETRKVPSLGK
jgi:protein-disulfide isomerase